VSPSENRAEYRLTAKRESGALADLLDATRDGAPVMIKLFQELSSDAAYARSIAETSRALALAQHPGIVRDLDVGVVRKRLAVVRPSVSGVPLGAALQKLNTREVILPTAVALAWTLELLELLQRAHDAGVVHGGITPGNVLLTDAGKLVLCDFGALRALFEVPGLKKGMLGGGRGGYRAPEVAMGELPTLSADIYSVGALLYELLTLREPGGGKDSGGRGMHTRREQMITPSRIDRRLNARIDPVVMRALDFTATRRYRSAVEFISALRNFLAESGGVPSTEELSRVVGELTVTPPASGAPPFTEPFRLEPIEGGVLAGVGERTMVFTERPAFSGGQVDPDEFPEDAATTEAPPAFEAFNPEATRVGRGTRPAEMPKFEDTEPSRAGPLEVGWVAPPGEAPRKKDLDRGGKSVVRPRVKVIEDFSVVERVPELASEQSISRSGKRPRDATAVRSPPPREAAEAPRPDWRNAAPDPDDQEAQAFEPDRPLRTDERRIVAAARRNRRFLLTVSGLSLLGALCFAAAIWKLNSSRGRAAQTDVHTVSPPPAQAQPPKPPPPPRPAVAPVKKVAPPAAITWDDPPSRRQAGYLNVRSNVPAYVYIDGARVRQHTPLRRYRVRPGHRKVVVEAISTGDRHEFTVVIVRGRTRAVEDRDLKGAPR